MKNNYIVIGDSITYGIEILKVEDGLLCLRTLL